MLNSNSFQSQTWPPPWNSVNTTVVDSLGNVSIASALVQTSRSSPPPSPPWGQRQAVQNYSRVINLGYKLQPLGVVPATGPFLGNHVGNVVLCNLMPVFGDQSQSRDLAKHHQIRANRVRSIRNKKRPRTWKSCLFSNLNQRQLKRLQRGPLVTAKKQEVYEKWEKRRIRREFRRCQQRQIMQMGSSMTEQSSFSLPYQSTVSTAFREGSQSPYQCPLWCCRRPPRVHRSRWDEFVQDKNARLRKKQPSRLSCLSDKSRSPITIRASPHT